MYDIKLIKIGRIKIEIFSLRQKCSTLAKY